MKRNEEKDKQSKEAVDVNSEQLTDPQRREAMAKLGKYTSPVMITLLAGDSAWAQTSGGGSGSGSKSDRFIKENVNSIDSRDILNKVAQLPITEWNYTEDNDEVRHIGPMAQDFMAYFGVGDSDKHINVVDMNGVNLAAIQGLHQLLDEKNKRINALEDKIEKLSELVMKSTEQYQ